MKPPYDQRFSDLLRSKVYEGLKLLKDNGRNPINFSDVFGEIGNVGGFGFLPEWQEYTRHWMVTIEKQRTEKKKRMVFHEYLDDLAQKGWIQEPISGLTSNFSEQISLILKETSD